MKLALISARPTIANKTKNIQIMENYINKTKADIYVFGEYFLSGDRCKDEFRDLAEPLTGPSIQLLKKIVKNKQCYIIFGMPTKDDKVDGLIYNTAVLIHPNGTVDAYKKWFLPTVGPFEEKIFSIKAKNSPSSTPPVEKLDCSSAMTLTSQKLQKHSHYKEQIFLSASPHHHQPPENILKHYFQHAH
jgi:predicted amidohydrolase